MKNEEKNPNNRWILIFLCVKIKIDKNVIFPNGSHVTRYGESLDYTQLYYYIQPK